MTDSFIGSTLNERYLIKKRIGSGGMALVYLAFDNETGNDVAIKILRDELLSDAEAVKRFITESQAYLMLSHPNIVKCYDIFNGENLKYIVMEYADGKTLKTLLNEKVKLSFDETISISIQILQALDHAHSNNVVHRDIKPQNIIIDKNGNLKITDFGIAQIQGSNPIAVSSLTIGTVDYISPEQAGGEPTDFRSDIYSLGILMYEMICGQLPFIDSNPMSVALMQIKEDPVPPVVVDSSISKGLSQIIMKAIEKKPSNRFENAKQMLDCLYRLKNNPNAFFEFVTFSDTFQDESSSSKSLDLFAENKPIKSTPNDNLQVVNFYDKPQKSNKKNKKENVEVIRQYSYKTKKTKVSFVSIVLGSLASLGLIALTVFVFVYETYFSSIINAGSLDTVVVHDFVGQIYDNKLLNNMGEVGYIVSTEWVNNSDFMYGTIISQSPKKSTRQAPDEDGKINITLYVSKGDNMVILEDVTGLEYRNACIVFNNQDIGYNIIKVSDNSIPKGRVISTYPSGGSVLAKHTPVTIYVSTGPELHYIEMPDLRGLTVMQVSESLTINDIMSGEITYSYSSEFGIGQIISQSIPKGQLIPSGLTRVDLVISLGES